MNLHDNWDKEFDKSFARMEKNTGRIFGLAIGAWLVSSLVYLAIIAGIVFVAIHFLSKVW